MTHPPPRCNIVVIQPCPNRKDYLTNSVKDGAFKSYIVHAKQCDNLDCVEFIVRFRAIQSKHGAK